MTTKPENKWDEIRMILQKMRANTLREIKKDLKTGTDSSLAGELLGDIYDQASIERDRELVLLLSDREKEKLNAIDEALLRIKEDEYGICEECEEEIPLGRLKVMPFAVQCVNCKSELEKHQALTGRVDEARSDQETPSANEEEDV